RKMLEDIERGDRVEAVGMFACRRLEIGRQQLKIEVAGGSQQGWINLGPCDSRAMTASPREKAAGPEADLENIAAIDHRAAGFAHEVRGLLGCNGKWLVPAFPSLVTLIQVT